MGRYVRQMALRNIQLSRDLLPFIVLLFGEDRREYCGLLFIRQLKK
jgi:hypothetical protein